MLFINKPLFKRDSRSSLADTSELRKITLLLILLTICTAAAIVGYTFLLHHIVGNSSSSTSSVSNLNKDFSIATNELLTISGRSSELSHVTSTRPIEKPKIGIIGDINNDDVNNPSNIDHIPSKLIPEKYNEFRSRSIREKMQQMSSRNDNQLLLNTAKKSETIQQLTVNFTTKNIHIFYSAPVNWYRPVNRTFMYTRLGTISSSSDTSSVNSISTDSLNIMFQPMLGIYTISTKILTKHFKNICGMGIGVIIVTWRPESQSTEMLKQIMNFVKQYHFAELSVAIEIDSYVGRTANSVRGNIELLHREFVWSHPALYRVFVTERNEYLPMIYVKDVGEIPYQEWVNVLSPKGFDTIRKTIYDGVFLGHISTKSQSSHVRQSYFNGFYTRLVSNGAKYTSTWKNWSSLKKIADKYKLLFVPTVGPGYDECKKEPRIGGYRRHRSNGQYYGVAWRTAMTLNVQFISIGSYNDWSTGTQIEEAVSRPGYKDYEPDGPTKYIDLTKQWVVEFVRLRANGTGGNCTSFINSTIC